jgi:hypothetical protein
MRRIALLLLPFAALTASPAWAQSADVTMQASQTRVAVGQVFVLDVRADVQGDTLDDVELPDLRGFEVVSRQVSRPFSFSFGFGRGRVVQSSTRHTLKLRALEPGTFRLEPARAVVGGRSFESDALTIEVRGGPGSAPGAGTSPGPQDDEAEVEGARFDSQAFIRTVVDRAEPRVGEQITVSISLYVRGGLSSAPAITQEPQTDGLWVHDLLPAARTLEATRETVRGVPFRAYELRRFAAFPLRPGELTIGPMEVRLETGSLLGLLQGSRAAVRKGVPVTIQVRPLPDPARQDVVVGRYRMEVDLDRQAVTAGDAVTLRAQLEGTGNVRDVQLELPEIPGLRSLAPRIDDDIQVSGNTVGGSRTFEWLLVAERPGTYRIAVPPLDVFEPDTERYRRLRTEPLELEVVGSPIAAQDEGEPTAGADDQNDTGAEARFGPIRPRSELRRAQAPAWTRPWYGMALALPPLAWLGLLAAGRIRDRADAHGRRQAPRRSVRRRLRHARNHAAANDPRGFYGEVAQALTEALGARLGEPVAGMTHAELHGHLVHRGMDSDLANRVVEELDGCDYARFSASGVTRDEMDRCLGRVDAMLDRIQRFRPSGEGPA